MKSSLLLALCFAVLFAGCSSAPAPAPVVPETHGVGNIVRLDPAFDSLVPRDAQIEKVGGGFQFTEGPLWRPEGLLWFSDVTGNVVRSLTPDGKIQILIQNAGGQTSAPAGSFVGPNGIAFSPDEKTLYVANSDEKHKVWMQYDVVADGMVSNGRVFADVTNEKEDGLPDGMKTDSQGNVYATGPGGVWVFSSEGKHLGTIKPPETPANCNWGEDGTALYITARTSLYRVKLAVAGKKALYQ